MLNYTELNSSAEHVLQLSNKEFRDCEKYIRTGLGSKITLKITEDCTTNSNGDCPDVLNYINAILYEKHLGRKSQIGVPPSGFAHNYVSNLRNARSGEKIGLSEEIRSVYGIDSKYIVIHFRYAKDDNLNRNFSNEAQFQPALDYLQGKGIQVVQIGESKGQLEGQNLIKIGKYSGDHDLQLLMGSEGFIGSSSGPSIWADYAGIPCLIVDVPHPLSQVILHTRQDAFFLPKRGPFKVEDIHDLMSNITDLSEVGILYWGKEVGLKNYDRPEKIYSCANTTGNSSKIILHSTRLFFEYVIEGNRRIDESVLVDSEFYCEYIGIESSAKILNPWVLEEPP